MRGDGSSVGKKWLIFDPSFLATVALVASLNYAFDKAFRGAVHLNPHLSILYTFQFNIVIPALDVALILLASFVYKRFRARVWKP